MANETIRARIEVLLKGMDQVESLKNAVRQLQNTASPAATDLQKLKTAATQLGTASDRTENDLRRSISALKDVRAQLSMTDVEYRKLTGTINKYQAQLDRATGAQQRGGRAMQFAQTAGAVAASGVFGGPEGLAGAAIGGVLGGAPGALAGGAVGAQVGMMRQQIGEFTTYSAEVTKLQIALKGVTGTQQEYQRALAAAAGVTRDFNVPQLEAAKGMTQLSAAVIGAGGKVADAEVVFRNVTAAIKASGGTSEDVSGALTALGQIFSKGKVSAEELQGQLGERLPGAVTMFAKATGRTLPQLQKDLEQGVVGLADLMKFVTSEQGLGQFEQRAKEISKSSADAGARLTVTWNNTKKAIGDALLPLGSQIQDSLGRALESATPALVAFAGAIGTIGKLMMDYSAPIGTVLKLLLGFGAAAGSAVAVTQIAGAFRAATLAIQAMGGAMGVASVASRALATSIAAIPGIGWIAAGITALGLLSVELYNNNEGFRGWVNNVASIVAGDFKAAWDNAVKIVQGAGQLISDAWDGLTGFAKRAGTAIASAFTGPLSFIPRVAKSIFGGVTQAIVDLWNRIPEPVRRVLGNGLKNAFFSTPTGYVASVFLRSFDNKGTQTAPGKTDLQAPASELTKWKTQEDEKNKKKKDDAEKLAREQQQLDEAIARAEIQLADAVFRNQMELAKKRFDYEDERIKQQRATWAGTFEGIRGDAARSFVDLQNRLSDLRKRVFESDQGLASAQQGLTSARRIEAVTSQGIASGIIARTGNTGQSTGAHLDLRWGDGRPITKADADRYFLINGKAPSSFGVTSPYGPRSMFGRSFHNGIDFGTPAGSAISLKGGATLKRNLGNTGAGGYAIEVMTPEGTMRALHLMAGSAVRSSGASSQVRRDVRAEGGVGVAAAGVAQAQQLSALDRAQVQGLEQLLPLQYAQEQTQSLRDQAKAMEDNNLLIMKRMQLEAQGMRPELLDAQMKIAAIEQERTQKLAQLNENLSVATRSQDPTAIAAVRTEIELTNVAYERQITAINALAQAQTASGVALSARIGQLRQELTELTNFENAIVSVSRVMETEISGAISSAVTGLVTGSQTIKQTLSQMLANIGQAFVKMATDIIAKQLVMITLQTVLKALGLGVSGGGGGGGGGGLDLSGFRQYSMEGAGMPFAAPFANGGVMTGRGPIPLKKYARGGVANGPQLALYGEGSKPEAYVPLPDGRRIPVALQGKDRMREVMGASPSQGAASPVLNMSFQTTNIGGVEYVSRDQLEAAMAETRRAASRDGARRGMTMTLDRLQQSPSTRTRVGLR